MTKSSTRLFAALIACLALTALLAFAELMVSRELSVRARALYREQEWIAELERLQAATRESESAARALDDRGFRETSSSASEHLARLEELASPDPLPSLRPLVERHQALFTEILRIRDERGPAAAAKFAATGAPAEVEEDLRALYSELERGLGSRMDQEQILFSTDSGLLRGLSLALGFLASACIALAWLFRRQLRSRFAEQESRLAHSSRMATLGVMAGGMAHEINTPLGLISLCTAKLEFMIQENKFRALPQDDQAEVRDSIHTIEKTVFRVAQIVRSLRTFARDGSADPFYRTRLKEVIDDALSLCQERLHQRGILLQSPEISPDLVVLCRPGQISQVLLNLLNNAVDAVGLKPASVGEKQKWIRLEVRETASEVEVSISDSGPGIAPADRARLMQPFFTTKEVGKGTGLGLSISRSIMEAHRGKLALDPESPHTRFYFTLPKAQAAPLSDRANAA